MKVVCAWCEKLLGGNPDDFIVSHGICAECMEKLNAVHMASEKLEKAIADAKE